MNRSVRSALAFLLIAVMPAMSIAGPHDNNSGGGGSGGGHSSSSGGGGSRGGSSGGGGGASHPSAPAAPSRPAPTQGFNLNHDIAPAAPRTTQPVETRTAPVQYSHTTPVQQHTAPVVQHGAQYTGSTGGQSGRRNTMPTNRRLPSFTSNVSGPYNGNFHGSHLHNGHYNGGAWGWNHGDEWQPAYNYWGGGFWGDLAIASLLTLASYGSYYDSDNQVYYPSYQLQPDSPGSEVLQDYGLTQTPCGPPNLVIIWGPDNSVVCTFPNDEVSPGNYELDPSTLTLVSQQ